MKYFISGHRIVDQDFFDKYYAPKLKEICERDEHAEFVVGDCIGVDQMAQRWLSENNLSKYTTVYHMFEKPRVIEGPFKTIGGFKNDIERDSAMTNTSDEDIAFILKGKWTSGTAQNILRRYEISDRQ